MTTTTKVYTYGSQCQGLAGQVCLSPEDRHPDDLDCWEGTPEEIAEQCREIIARDSATMDTTLVRAARNVLEHIS